MLNPSQPSVSVIIPTFREADNLPLIVPQVAAALAARGWPFEIIVVDDNSPDATPEVLQNLARTTPQLRYKIRTDERGLSSAVLAGMAMAQNDYLVTMDADLSHPPEAVPLLVDKLLSEADFVIGSRYVPGGKTEDWGFFRWLNSAGATLLAKPFVGQTRDPMAGFFALPRRLLETAGPLSPVGYKIGLELLVKCHVQRIAEVPITFRNRIHGESKLTMKEQFHYLEHLSLLYDYKYPKASARTKFLIAAGCGALACVGTVGGLQRWSDFGFPINIAFGLLAMIAVTFAFFARYVHAQRDSLHMQHPYSEFVYISLAELVTGWFFAVSTVSANSASYVKAAMGIAVLLIVRYALRKVFMHDLRGLRGVPKANFQVTARTAPRVRAASA